MGYIKKMNLYRRAGKALQLNYIGTIGPSILLGLIFTKAVETLAGSQPGVILGVASILAWSFAAANVVVFPAWGKYYLGVINMEYGQRTTSAVIEAIHKSDSDVDIDKIALAVGEGRSR